ncbi:hypothetical protein DD592_27210, partial [Enterobacter cloacae complex sp. 2DZ2F20B]
FNAPIHEKRIFIAKCENFEDFQKFDHSNLVFQKSCSKTINTLYFSNDHIEIYIPELFVVF